MIARRLIHTSKPRLQAAVTRPRRVGALRGGLTGFLLGVTASGIGAYYYLFAEYTAGQQAILADVIALRTSIKELQGQVDHLKEESSK